MFVYDFSATTMTVNGQLIPVEYFVDEYETVFITAFVPGWEGKRIRIAPEDSQHAAALDAAHAMEMLVHFGRLGAEQEAARAAYAAAQSNEAQEIPAGNTAATTDAGNIITVSRHESITDTPAADDAAEAPAAVPAIIPQLLAPAQAETVPQLPAPAQDAPTARSVPEKDFIGQTINGNGWKILFDGETQRTRIIFDADPTAAARAALDRAGFYFSSVMHSWNKKLTFKARRAALALSAELATIYA